MLDRLCREARELIDGTMEFAAWLHREDGMALPLQCCLAKVGCFGSTASTQNEPRALLEMKPPEENLDRL